MDSINIFPHGLSLGQGTFRPAMIFKDKQQSEVLPVWLNNYESNILLSSAQSSVGESTPHKASLKIFESFGITLESIYFNEVTNSIQYAEVTAAQGNKKVKSRVLASEAMSLALNAGCVFLTNKEVIEASRVLNFQMVLHEGQVGAGAANDPGILH